MATVLDRPAAKAAQWTAEPKPYCITYFSRCHDRSMPIRRKGEVLRLATQREATDEATRLNKQRRYARDFLLVDFASAHLA